MHSVFKQECQNGKYETKSENMYKSANDQVILFNIWRLFLHHLTASVRTIHR